MFKGITKAVKKAASNLADASKNLTSAYSAKKVARRGNDTLKLANKKMKAEIKHIKTTDKINKLKAKKLSSEKYKLKQRHKTLRHGITAAAAIASQKNKSDFRGVEDQLKQTTSGMTMSNGQDGNDPNTAPQTTYSTDGSTYGWGDHI